jgi:hypothetical protein
VEADWFVRIAKPKGGFGDLIELLTERLGPPSTVAGPQEATAEYRVRLIAAELAWAKAREAALRAEVAQLKLIRSKERNSETEIETLRLALEEEQRLRQEADLAAYR